MALQLATLCLAAGRVPLSARFPQPAERQAVAEMLAVQIGAGALLFPLLLRDASRVIFVIASVWPMLLLANLMADEPTVHIASAGVYVTVWLMTLALWRRLLTTDFLQRAALSLATLWTLGGPILLYLHAELGAWANSDSSAWAAAAGPIWAALLRLWSGRWVLSADFPLLALLAGATLFTTAKVFFTRQVTNKLSTK
jgi:hypothetical protein